jgi:hypothetical protein
VNGSCCSWKRRESWKEGRIGLYVVEEFLPYCNCNNRMGYIRKLLDNSDNRMEFPIVKPATARTAHDGARQYLSPPTRLGVALDGILLVTCKSSSNRKQSENIIFNCFTYNKVRQIEKL